MKAKKRRHYLNAKFWGAKYETFVQLLGNGFAMFVPQIRVESDFSQVKALDHHTINAIANAIASAPQHEIRSALLSILDPHVVKIADGDISRVPDCIEELRAFRSTHFPQN